MHDQEMTLIVQIRSAYCPPVVQIHSLPVWVVPRIERPSFLLKLIGEDEMIRLAVVPLATEHVFWRIRVDELAQVQIGDLARAVDAAEVVARVRDGGVADSVVDRVTKEEHEEAGNEGGERKRVDPAARGEGSEGGE